MSRLKVKFIVKQLDKRFRRIKTVTADIRIKVDSTLEEEEEKNEEGIVKCKRRMYVRTYVTSVLTTDRKEADGVSRRY